MIVLKWKNAGRDPLQSTRQTGFPVTPKRSMPTLLIGQNLVLIANQVWFHPDFKITRPD